MKILFFMRHHGYLRMYESTLRQLLDRGHDIAVVFEVKKAVPIAEDLASSYAKFSYAFADPGKRNDARELAMRIRTAGDYLRYLDPAFADCPRLRGRVEKRAPRGFLNLLELPLAQTALGRALIRSALRLAEASFPSIPEVEALIKQHAPDLVLVTPLVDIPSPQNEYVRSAKALGIPTGLCVNSWDNLTNKGVVWEMPDRVFLWNEQQKTEAVKLHGVPPERVVATGAQAFDKWFGVKPTLDADAFARKIGLPRGTRFLLYVASSAFIADAERQFVERWIRAIRSSPDPDLVSIGIVVRPHPGNLEQWRGWDGSHLENVARWPAEGRSPLDADWYPDYQDSLLHCDAVAGINTSALIEAGIVGRGVYTILAPEFAETQEGTLHFHHLLRENGGLLEVARDLDEHVRQLAVGQRLGRDRSEQNRPFVESFVRPNGLTRNATLILAEAIERLGAKRPHARTFAQRALRPVGATIAMQLAKVVGNRMEEKRLRAAESASRQKKRQGVRRLLFVMRHAGYARNFESTIRLLAERGHTVHLVFEKGKGKKDVVLRDSLAESIAAEYPNVTIGAAAVRELDEWVALAQAVRQAANYLRYLTPRYREATKLRARAEGKVVDGVRRVASWPLMSTSAGRGLLAAALRLVERSIPRSPALDRFMREQKPDIMLVTPLVEFGSTQSDYVLSAHAAGIRTCLCVYSWDNLTNKGLIRDKPQLVAVWNEAQKREAVELHGVRPDSVVVTGAPNFDHWFDREPSRDRARFLTQVGLSPDRPMVLYLGSSPFIAPDETGFVRRWLHALRSSGDPGLRDIGVLIRPHPQNAAQWHDADLGDLEPVIVWPRLGADPVDDSAKNDFFDSMYHCQAVVGINTSALIESAIVGRPVLTVLAPEFRETQEGTLHFHHLARDEDGLLAVASSLEEHLAQLADALADPSAARERGHRFVNAFVRPAGLSLAATPALVEAIERLGEAPAPVPESSGLIALTVRRLVQPLAAKAISRAKAGKAKKARAAPGPRRPSGVSV